MDGLQIGRIVHYVLSKSDPINLEKVGEHRAAIITDIEEKYEGVVSLRVFLNGERDTWHVQYQDGFQAVCYPDLSNNDPGTWHWIERK